MKQLHFSNTIILTTNRHIQQHSINVILLTNSCQHSVGYTAFYYCIEMWQSVGTFI